MFWCSSMKKRLDFERLQSRANTLVPRPSIDLSADTANAKARIERSFHIKSRAPAECSAFPWMRAFIMFGRLSKCRMCHAKCQTLECHIQRKHKFVVSDDTSSGRYNLIFKFVESPQLRVYFATKEMARSRSHSRSYSSSPSSSSRRTKSRRRSKSPSSSRRKQRYRSPEHSYKSKKSSRRYHSRRSQSPYYERDRRHRRSLSRSNSRSKYSTTSSSTSSSTSASRSPSPNRNAKSTAAPSRIKLQKTPSPPPPPTLAFTSAMEYLDGRHGIDAIDDINADEFVPKSFKTEAVKSGKNDTVDAAAAKSVKIHTNAPNEDPIFHQSVSDGGRWTSILMRSKERLLIDWLVSFAVLCRRRRTHG